ncbi:MAG: 50S ribosomal protein L22 [Candidatus Moranbacteria bacterium]|nr:50S ribosomal protein L22 [Candidatus Moranbacteria bacterium]
MQVKSKLKNFRVSAKKIRPVARSLQGKEVKKARQQLLFLSKKISQPLIKLLDSAVANAINNNGYSKDNLFIESIKIDQGMVLKRWRPRAHGRAYPILKRSSHIELTVNEINPNQARSQVKTKKAKTISYQELKKAISEAEDMMKTDKKAKSKKAKLAKKKKPPSASDLKKEPAKKPNKKGIGGMVSKFFRRKSG